MWPFLPGSVGSTAYSPDGKTPPGGGRWEPSRAFPESRSAWETEVGVRRNGTLPQRQLARALRRLREEAGLSLEEAAPRLDWSTSKLGRIETAQQGVDVHGVRSMLDLYNVGGAQWTEILELTREAKQKGWWHAYGLKLAGYPALEADA